MPVQKSPALLAQQSRRALFLERVFFVPRHLTSLSHFHTKTHLKHSPKVRNDVLPIIHKLTHPQPDTFELRASTETSLIQM